MDKKIENTNIIYGKNPVLEALEAGKDIEKVFVLSTLKGPYEKQIRYWAKEQNIPLVKVPQDKLTSMVGNKAHQGTVAVIAPIKYHDLNDFLDQNKEGQIRLLLLDGVKDVRNIGAIARSAVVFGIDGLIVSAKNAGRINEDTVKASAGAILNIPVIRVSSALAGVEQLKERGIAVIASDLKSDAYLHEYSFPDRCAVIMGSEDKGVDRNILSKVDASIKIAQHSDFDSLNVSVAAGLIVYEWSKQG